MSSKAFSTHLCHEYQLERNSPRLGYDPSRDFEQWKLKLREKLRELVGEEPEKAPLDIRIEFDRTGEEFRERRFVFTSEPGADVPCHLLVPNRARHPVPVIICLQGHSPGMHISLGRPANEQEHKSLEGHRDFAIQAVRQGYAALALEQRSFGERKDGRPDEVTHFGRNCSHASMAALMLGRTMIGERVWDVSRAIDALAGFPELDLSRIACLGNSGGGTITYYAACLEPRIAAAMPSCSFCTYAGSIFRIDHCVDNYIPQALRWFELADLSALIAPRPIVVVAGRTDPIFPIASVEEAMQTTRLIYKAAGAADKCRLVVGDEGHQFYPDFGWPVFNQLTGWKD